ncbi:Oxo-4-hydroxy-4-carboxy-5-ureidoimidazoline decarboxylase [Sparassis latifolia]|uniref:Oxo-4-hydroxy-4-carboxy-5-ureidoimidazoline decarboxylase domain-containing protein n=1 Tax=Sparassis crispa TaxID=139825 RepID=A0A401GVV4_9APHY|nr:hypothetical protein SCP_0902360 [Sparassis crispa]GBE86357.1 hypothetical protein SCP_0902360 [Sparassis crispa]
MMSALPSFSDLVGNSPDLNGALLSALEILFEPSPVLSKIVFDISSPTRLGPRGVICSYSDLIDVALNVISRWDDELKARFIAGHPRIGEVKNLSHLSAREQAAVATRPAILVRLGHLNACYEHRYPGLRYIIFVNGRSREAIKEEMESVLGIERSLSPDQPPVKNVSSVQVGGREWKDELARAIVDVGRIAKDRVRALGVE